MRFERVLELVRCVCACEDVNLRSCPDGGGRMDALHMCVRGILGMHVWVSERVPVCAYVCV